MKLAIVIYSNDTETAWNAFRLGSHALIKGDTVKVFLLGRGVECESLPTDNFNVQDEMQKFVDASGEILACGTCLKIRNSKGTELCPLSSMGDLYDMINTSDKVVSF